MTWLRRRHTGTPEPVTFDIPPACPVCGRFLAHPDVPEGMACRGHIAAGTTSPTSSGATSQQVLPAAATPLPIPANPAEVIQRLTILANFLGATVVMSVPPVSLSRGRFDLEERKIMIYGGYSPEAQGIELAHQVVHTMTPMCWRQPVDCSSFHDRAQSWEQLAESIAVLLAQKLGWRVDDRDGESIWGASISEERQQELMPHVEHAAQELGRGLGLSL